MPQEPHVVVYNDPSSGEKDSDIEAMVPALQKQVGQFAEFWHILARVTFTPSTSKPPKGSWVIAILNNSDEAGALGYHDLTPDGLPLGKVFAGTDRRYGEKVSVTLSHELLEMLGDPWIDLSAQGPDGKFYAWEACDAVEADEYEITVNGVVVPVSNFATPAWWGNGLGQLDYLKRVSKPLALRPGGYISVFDPSSGRGWTQITAAHAPRARSMGREEAARIVAHAVPRVGSRRERRQRFASGGPRIGSTYQTA